MKTPPPHGEGACSVRAGRKPTPAAGSVRLARDGCLVLVGAGDPSAVRHPYHGGCSGRHRSHKRTLMTSSEKNRFAHFMQHRHPTCLTTRGGRKLWSSTCSRRLPPSHGQASGSSRSCPRPCGSWSLALAPAGLTFSTFGACARCAGAVRGLGVASRLGVLVARAARCAARASRCSAARFAPASTRSRLSACHAASQAGVSASVVIAARPHCP